MQKYQNLRDLLLDLSSPALRRPIFSIYSTFMFDILPSFLILGFIVLLQASWWILR